MKGSDILFTILTIKPARRQSRRFVWSEEPRGSALCMQSSFNCVTNLWNATKRIAGPGLRRAVRRRLLYWFPLRLRPLSRKFGADRGTPIDRYYIERFLQQHRNEIRGRVLEVGEPVYTRRFGGQRITHSDVLHAEAGNPQATLVGDLATGDGIPQEAFDCIIFTQTLPFIYDFRSALVHVRSALRPGGVLLGTLPGVSQISRYDMDRWGDYWRFTGLSARRSFEDAFGAGQVSVEVFGNVLVATAFLYGLSVEDLRSEELDHRDDDYHMLITVRAVRK